MRTVFPLLTLAAVFVLCSLAHVWISEGHDRAIELQVSPRVGMAPLDLVVLVKLLPVESDRWLHVAIEGESYSTATDRQLEGEKSPKYFRFEWKRVGAGESEVSAAIGQGSVTRASDHVTVLVH